MHRLIAPGRKATAATNITETDSGYQLDVMVPGYHREDITIKVEDHHLTITADKATTEDTPTANYQEWRLLPINRRWTLGKEIDANDVDAKLEHGILSIKLAKQPEAKPKTIEIA